MKLLKFSENRDRVTSLLLAFSDNNSKVLSLNNQSQETVDDVFEIDLITDEGERRLYDYRVFDPGKTWFTGKLFPSGWSDWQRNAYQQLGEEERKSWDKATAEKRPTNFEVGMNVKSFCQEDKAWEHGRVSKLAEGKVFVQWKGSDEDVECQSTHLKDLFLDYSQTTAGAMA